MTTVSIIIVSYNARADLERCLTSLAVNPPSASHEIIVVDNASTDGSAAAARACRGVTVLELPVNRGFAAANNAGIGISQGRLLLILNSDTLVPSGAVDRMVATLDSRPEIGVVGPRLIDGSGRAELSFGSMLSPLVEWRRQRLMRAVSRGDQEAVDAVETMTRTEQRPDWVSAACLVVSRTDADSVGLFDERFFMYTEDVDFCAMIRGRGRGILFTPHAEIVHLRGRSGAADPDQTRAGYRRSHLAFYRKHHPLWAPFVWVYHAVTN